MKITVIYTFLIVFLAAFFDTKKVKGRNIYIIIVGFVLFLISGLRNLDVGPDDTTIYYQSYLANANYSYKEVYSSTPKDPFYSLFVRALYDIIGPNYTVLLCVFAAIFVFSVCRLLIKNNTEDPLLSFVILLAMGFFAFSMTAIRQIIAMSFTLWSYQFLKEKKLIKFIICVYLGSLFHKTALVFMIVYPLMYFKLDWKTILMYIAGGIIVVIQGEQLLSQLFASDFDARLESYEAVGVHGLTISGLIQLALFLALALFYFKEVKQMDSNAIIFYHMLILAVIFQLFTGILAEFFRIAMYYSIFLILLMPKVISAIPNLLARSLIRNGLIALLLIYFLAMGSGRIPYHFFFN